jgi:hypothetical protein
MPVTVSGVGGGGPPNGSEYIDGGSASPGPPFAGDGAESDKRETRSPKSHSVQSCLAGSTCRRAGRAKSTIWFDAAAMVPVSSINDEWMPPALQPEQLYQSKRREPAAIAQHYPRTFRQEGSLPPPPGNNVVSATGSCAAVWPTPFDISIVLERGIPRCATYSTELLAGQCGTINTTPNPLAVLPLSNKC